MEWTMTFDRGLKALLKVLALRRQRSYWLERENLQDFRRRITHWISYNSRDFGHHVRSNHIGFAEYLAFEALIK